jgi:4-hydroxyphenylpyruvate dioxygenase
LPTSLFFKLVLDLDIAQPLDLIDPYGIVVSRTATNQSKSIRLPFNMSKSWGASTERFREAQKGSGVQHIAISCDDIFAYIARIDRDIILPIPKNYYVDLQSKFDLDNDFIARMESNNILYDRSETGEFFHFYTAAINGVFFEVVQRNQYANYGEVNAQVRMSAQARLRKLGNEQKNFNPEAETAG